MSELPEVSSEELYKSLFEKVTLENRDLRIQLTGLELLATKLRDQRDSLTESETNVE